MNNEWETEPDRKEGVYKGVKWLILRMPETKHLCGYVQVPKEFCDIPYNDLNIQCHGGLTFSGKHYSAEGYWIGFDCVHSGDFYPGNSYRLSHHNYETTETYKNISFVENECIKIIDQLKKGFTFNNHIIKHVKMKL